MRSGLFGAACFGVPILLGAWPGSGFAGAYLPHGITADATITLTFLDNSGLPVVNFPAEDMWIQAVDGGLIACSGGTTADRNTDANGQTLWQRPPKAGGWSRTHCQVVINGEVVPQDPILLDFVSPDLSGDRKVDLQDVGVFANDYFGVYAPRSDLRPDGSVNLADLGVLAAHYAANCP